MSPIGVTKIPVYNQINCIEGEAGLVNFFVTWWCKGNIVGFSQQKRCLFDHLEKLVVLLYKSPIVKNFGGLLPRPTLIFVRSEHKRRQAELYIGGNSSEKRGKRGSFLMTNRFHYQNTRILVLLHFWGLAFVSPRTFSNFQRKF